MARTTKTTARHQFLAVVISGPDAEYTTEPRHRVELELPFNLSGRSSAEQLRNVCHQVRWKLSEFLPQNAAINEDSLDGFHVWLCNESGQPSLFVSGLLVVREGRATKVEADTLHRRLLPQINCKQQFREFRACVCVNVQTWCEYDEPVGYGDELTERENEHLDELERVFHKFWLNDMWQEDDGTLDLWAEGWRLVTLRLPFEPSSEGTTTQLRFASVIARSEVQRVLPEGWEIDDEKDDVLWILDEHHQPTQYVTGLLDVREGRLPKRKLKAATEEAQKWLGMWSQHLLEAV